MSALLVETKLSSQGGCLEKVSCLTYWGKEGMWPRMQMPDPFFTVAPTRLEKLGFLQRSLGTGLTSKCGSGPGGPAGNPIRA